MNTPSPLEIIFFAALQKGTSEERAAFDTASDWNTCVKVHAFTDDAIRQAVEAGVKFVEHGHLTSEATMKLLAEKSRFRWSDRI